MTPDAPSGGRGAGQGRGGAKGAVGAVDEAALRALVPAVIPILVRRGADFAAAEDAVQESLLEALRRWGAHPSVRPGRLAAHPSAAEPPAAPPEDPKAWLVTVAWRKFLDAGRADASRRAREERVAA